MKKLTITSKDISQKQWSQLWESRFMIDMCNGMRIKLNKFRRQASNGTPLDFEHFRFVGSIYPGKMCLSHALMQARANYPAQGRLCLGTSLCISHQCRIIINRAVNKMNQGLMQSLFQLTLSIEVRPISHRTCGFTKALC